jgi:hypothetical protein
MEEVSPPSPPSPPSPISVGDGDDLLDDADDSMGTGGMPARDQFMHRVLRHLGPRQQNQHHFFDDDGEIIAGDHHHWHGGERMCMYSSNVLIEFLHFLWDLL